MFFTVDKDCVSERERDSMMERRKERLEETERESCFFSNGEMEIGGRMRLTFVQRSYRECGHFECKVRLEKTHINDHILFWKQKCSFGAKFEFVSRQFWVTVFLWTGKADPVRKQHKSFTVLSIFMIILNCTTLCFPPFAASYILSSLSIVVYLLYRDR